MGETARSVFCSVYDITFSKPVTLASAPHIVPPIFTTDLNRHGGVSVRCCGTDMGLHTHRHCLTLRRRALAFNEANDFRESTRSLPDHQQYQTSSRYTHPPPIAYLRALRHSGQPADTAQASIAIQLTRELLSVDDRKTEGLFLRHVKLVPTDDARDTFAAPFSLEFRNLTEYREAILYWTSRLLVVTLALELATLTSGSGLDGPEIYGSQTRLMQQLFMSWQYASSGGGVPELPATTSLSMSLVVDLFQGYLVIWAGLFQRMSFKGLAIQAVKAWMLPKMRNRIIGWTMDATQQTYVPSVPHSMLNVFLADNDYVV
ncbi:hypothetical protein LTR27_001423 [Elasticomyces elasticus]|nr:hypothetical protein LTR27_001423 [Elasticomyces elasticus]